MLIDLDAQLLTFLTFVAVAVAVAMAVVRFSRAMVTVLLKSMSMVTVCMAIVMLAMVGSDWAMVAVVLAVVLGVLGVVLTMVLTIVVLHVVPMSMTMRLYYSGASSLRTFARFLWLEKRSISLKTLRSITKGSQRKCVDSPSGFLPHTCDLISPH